MYTLSAAGAMGEWRICHAFLLFCIVATYWRKCGESANVLDKMDLVLNRLCCVVYVLDIRDFVFLKKWLSFSDSTECVTSLVPHLLNAVGHANKNGTPLHNFVTKSRVASEATRVAGC